MIFSGKNFCRYFKTRDILQKSIRREKFIRKRNFYRKK